MELREYKCSSCGAEIVPREAAGVYVCCYCHKVNVFPFLPAVLTDRKEARDALDEKLRQLIDTLKLTVMLFGGGILPQFITAMHIGLFHPFERWNMYNGHPILTAMVIDIVLMGVSVGCGLFGTVKSYYSHGYDKGIYNFTVVGLIMLMLTNMLLHSGSIIHGISLLQSEYETPVTVMFVAVLTAALIVYPVYRGSYFIKTAKKQS